MMQQNSENTGNNIIESMDQAFGHHGFYGLEYVLDEWLEKKPPIIYQNPIESFHLWDFRD
ncbi:MAG: hypothetical protein PHH59_13690 [Methylovulum sp.]|uniref:hypothetical protein n=1 Tax=Methylovulum sp. TaxID=1916980 RepID=UPI0026035893|nr:hypothetical protein [Methylovulum sp.]MDD2725059.1 hypothetical protein [Methylovulum sp.]MDD5125929.1 hypothetical protein [Methylovulum sp.]